MGLGGGVGAVPPDFSCTTVWVASVFAPVVLVRLEVLNKSILRAATPNTVREIKVHT